MLMKYKSVSVVLKFLIEKQNIYFRNCMKDIEDPTLQTDCKERKLLKQNQFCNLFPQNSDDCTEY